MYSQKSQSQQPRSVDYAYQKKAVPAKVKYQVYNLWLVLCLCVLSRKTLSMFSSMELGPSHVIWLLHESQSQQPRSVDYAYQKKAVPATVWYQVYNLWLVLCLCVLSSKTLSMFSSVKLGPGHVIPLLHENTCEIPYNYLTCMDHTEVNSKGSPISLSTPFISFWLFLTWH